MQQIPAKESVGNKYRNAFVPPAGWSFVSSDYVSQELVVIAYLSKDPVWQEALSKGQDLHSIAAELVFKDKWKNAAESTCTYYNPSWVSFDKEDVISEEAYNKLGRPDGWTYSEGKQKCKCKKHKYMRSGCKSINFGLAYGMSKFKLAATLRISVPEADKLIAEYFKTFPGIKNLLDYLGRFGVEKGYIQTIRPLFRRRWFPYWKYYTKFIDAHIMTAQFHPGLGEIERASKNQPIQGSSADMMKFAIRDTYYYIHKHNLSDKVKMAMQVHDQLDCVTVDSFKQEWGRIQTGLMENAALLIIKNGLLKAETTITARWSK
jgi:DNA polymerase-1